MSDEFVCCCRLCRGVLFEGSELVLHDPPAAGGKGFKRQQSVEELSECTSYFLDPDTSPWISQESRDAREVGGLEPDTIYCPHPRCRAKIGTQNWSGDRCSCGAWVTPSFKILKKAVDKFPKS